MVLYSSFRVLFMSEVERHIAFSTESRKACLQLLQPVPSQSHDVHDQSSLINARCTAFVCNVEILIIGVGEIPRSLEL